MSATDRIAVLPECSHPALGAAVAGLPLPAAARLLHAREHERGFAAYDAEQVDFFRFPPYRGLGFTVQHVPHRALRPQSPPVCPLCADAVIASDQGYLAITLGARPYRVLANPYAFMPSALTVVAAEHRPQGWDPADVTSSEEARSLATEAALLAAALEGHVVIWNGIRAGASLPAHAHLSVFELPVGHGPLAIAEAAARRHHRSGWHGAAGEYPAVFHFAKGAPDIVAQATATAMRAWDRLEERAATGNLVARATLSAVEMYFFPRSVRYPHAPCLAGALGALELCGSFVLSTEWELDALRARRLDARALYAALRSVSPASAAGLVSEGFGARV
jgi:hypothetical protein